MNIGIPKEIHDGEKRVAISPNALKKLTKRGFTVWIEESAGLGANFSDKDFLRKGVEIVNKDKALSADIIFKIHPPTQEEIQKIKSGALLLTHINAHMGTQTMELLAQAGVQSVGMELIPRTSRAQSMDALSSQANIAGYRAVLEAFAHYRRFAPMMMTSAGMAKPAKVAVLGVGVAGLQAIATARRLGASVEAYDIRPEVAEQIRSLGAKVIQVDIGEDGTGEGGYAKELSQEAKKKQQAVLQEKLKTFDICITTANLPGKKSPLLIFEDCIQQMRTGSVIVDMAAANGGNCELSKPNAIVQKHGVTIVGYTNYPAMVASDASDFYANNLIHLLDLFVKKEEAGLCLQYNLEDDIIDAALVTYQKQVRFKGRK